MDRDIYLQDQGTPCTRKCMGANMRRRHVLLTNLINKMMICYWTKRLLYGKSHEVHESFNTVDGRKKTQQNEEPEEHVLMAD